MLSLILSYIECNICLVHVVLDKNYNQYGISGVLVGLYENCKMIMIHFCLKLVFKINSLLSQKLSFFQIAGGSKIIEKIKN